MEQGGRVWAEGGDSGGGYAPATTSRMAESGGSAPALVMGHGVEAGVGGSGHQHGEEPEDHGYDQGFDEEDQEEHADDEEEQQYDEGADEQENGEEENLDNYNFEDQKDLQKLLMLKKLKDDLERELLMKERLEKEVQLQQLLHQEAQMKQLLALKMQEKALAEGNGREESMREQKPPQQIRGVGSGSQRAEGEQTMHSNQASRAVNESGESPNQRQSARPAPQRPSTASSRGEGGDSDATVALLVKMKDTIEMLRTQLKRKDEEVLHLANQKQELLELVEKMDAMKAIDERKLEEAVKSKLDHYEELMKNMQTNMQEKVSSYSQFKSKFELAEKEKENLHKTLVESSSLNHKFKDLLQEKQKVIDHLVTELDKFNQIKDQITGALKINQDQKALLEQKDNQIAILNEKLDQMAEISKEFLNVQNFVGQASSAIKEMKEENVMLSEKLAEAEVLKENLEKKVDPLEKENDELREQLDSMKEELQKTEEVEKQVKDVLEKFEGILKASEADNKRLRLEVQEASILREENEALKMFVQKATVMVTTERAKNQELTKLLQENHIRVPAGGNPALEQSRSTVDAMRESLRSRQSVEGKLRSADSGSKYGDDEQINEVPEDQENETENSKPSSKHTNQKKESQNQGISDSQNIQRSKAPKESQVSAKKNSAASAMKSPSKAAVQSGQKPSLSSNTPKMMMADSLDFKLNQAQLKKQPQPRFVRGSDAVDSEDYTSPNQETLEQDADQDDRDELYQSRMSGKGLRASSNRMLISGGVSAEQEEQMLELLEQNKQLKMMNDLLHSSQKQLLQTKQQQLDNSISKVVCCSHPDIGTGTHSGCG